VYFEEFDTALCQNCKAFKKLELLKKRIKGGFEENKEMIDILGSDYDKGEVSYWEKYKERLKYMEDNGI
jgi:hypothetical protein